ncbi:hypothetical protein AB5J62_13030 [Amycolatopsis sp. cg5]|uniref:hypothetical protein n=1 Tax=Amycolatopsis sp. cg5 TaxID=3238802 RepID=UPI003524CAE7
MMDEFERRVRTALGELADSVPSSSHSWAEHHRRRELKQRRRRRKTVLVAAAAAIVLVAAVLVPSVLPHTDRERTGASPAPVRGPVYVLRPGTELLAGPFVLTTYVEDGQMHNAAAYVTANKDSQGPPTLCIWSGVAGEPVGTGPKSACYVSTVDKNPEATIIVTGRSVPDGVAKAHQGMWVFMTGARVASLRVYNRDGGMSESRLIGAGGGYNLFSGEFTDPGWFDAYDVHGVFIRSGKP